MKRVFSLVLLLAMLFIGFELIVNHFTKSYSNSYKIYSNDKTFEIEEKYDKKLSNKYYIRINIDNKEFYYIVNNIFNKQKKIIKDIILYQNGDDICAYPILKNNKGTYIECNNNGTLYSSLSYHDKNFINNIKSDLKTKNYIDETIISDKVTDYNGTKVYNENFNKNDLVIMWKYKGIESFDGNKFEVNKPLMFDKYDNKTGALVGKYYIIPDYTRSNILEFSSVNVIDVNTMKGEKIKLEYTLSSDTYINGIVDNKLYYTDPSNLLQIEINPANKKVRLIGSEQIGGQMYDGDWKNRNIYDFRNATITYNNLNEISNHSYKEAKIGTSSYYYIDNNGNVYQVPKGYLDKRILLFNNTKINNFNVVSDDIYYVDNDTVYYYNIEKEIIPILINKDLIYNTANRISVYRNSSN